jgi:hypothetical protein
LRETFFSNSVFLSDASAGALGQLAKSVFNDYAAFAGNVLFKIATM